MSTTNHSRFLPLVCMLIAFAFLIAASATTEWSEIYRSSEHVMTVAFGPYRVYTVNDGDTGYDYHTLSTNDVNNYCKESGYPDSFCNSFQATRAFCVLAVIGSGITAVVAAIAAHRSSGAAFTNTPTLPMVVSVMGVVSGTFALIAFAIGYDTFVNQFTNHLNSAFGYEVAYSKVRYGVGLMVIGWIMSWLGAAIAGVWARNRRIALADHNHNQMRNNA